MNLNEFLAQLSVALVPVIATALTGLIGVGIAYLTGKVKQQFGEAAAQKADEYLSVMEEIASNTVIALQQSVVDRLKASGEWNKETAERVKGDAVRLAVESMGALRGKVEAKLMIDVPKYMEGLIETALYNHKGLTSLDGQQG